MGPDLMERLKSRREELRRAEPSAPELDPVDPNEALEPVAPSPEGPFDVDAVPPEELATLVDTGGILWGPVEGVDVHAMMDDAGALLHVYAESGAWQMRLEAFAAPRREALWPGASAQIAAELRASQVTVDTAEGEYGTTLSATLIPVGPDGAALEPVRVHLVGVDGPRWLLRTTFTGPQGDRTDVAALLAGPLGQTLRRSAVRRGTEAMPAGESLPVRLPVTESAPEAEAAHSPYAHLPGMVF